MADKKITRQLSIFINGKEVKNSLGGIGREIATVKKLLKEANDPADIKKYKAELDQLGAKYGEVKEEIHGTNSALSDAKGHWDNMLSGFLSGNLKQAAIGLKGLSVGIKAAAASAWAFVATPLGATLLVLAGVAGVTKLWVDYNLELYKTTQLTKQLTGLNGQVLKDFRDDVSGVSETFNKEYNDVLKSANTLAKQMRISHAEAIGLIEQGFARGADVNGDFLKKLEEYPVQFKNAGYSAQEFIDVATQEAKGGIYDDKLLDTIKEINLSLTELDDAQIKVLESNFGKKYANQLIDDIDSGRISSKQAFESIISESQKVGLSVTEQQKIVADIMKSAGEDVGGFSEVVKQLNEAFDENNKKLDKNEAATLRLSGATSESKKALADLFDASQSGFPTMLTNLKAVGQEIFTNFLRGIKLSTTSLEQLMDTARDTGSTGAAQDVVEDMQRFDSSKEDAVKYKLETAQKNIDRVKKQLEDVSMFSQMLGGEKTLKTELAKYVAYQDELLKIASDTSIKFNEISETYINPDDPVKPTGNTTDKKTDSEADKKLVEARTKLYEKAGKELNEILNKQNDERLLNLKTGFEKEDTAIDQKYDALKEKFTLSEEEKTTLSLEQIEARENQIAELEDLKAREKQELKKVRDAEFKEELDLIEEENKILDDEARFNLELAAATSQDDRDLLLLSKAKDVANKELQIEKDKELAKVKEYENAEILRAAIKAKYDKKQAQIDTEFSKSEKALKSDVVDWTKLTEEQKLNTIKGALNGASEAFNEGSDAWKATKIAETVITTYQSAVNSYNSLAGIPVVGPALGAAAAGLAVATGLKQVSQIANTKIEKMPSHYYGGPTGSEAIYNDQYGAVTGVVHEDEWVAPKVMTENPRYAPTLKWLESERKKNLGQFFDGGNTSTTTPNFDTATNTETNSTTPTFQSETDALLLAEISRLNNHLDNGLYTLIGDDDIIKYAERLAIIKQTRTNAKIQ